MVRGVQSLFSKPWPKPGKLHVYALPDDHLRDVIVGFQSIMDETDYCVPQPRAFLHATVQSLPVYLDDSDPARLSELRQQLAELAAGTAPFRLQATGPYVNSRGITVNAEPTAGWLQLVDGVREVATRTITTPDAIGAPPFAPHISVGYGRADGSSEPLEKALAELGRSIEEDFVIDRIHLLAVNQHVADGFFDWEPVADFALAG